MDDLRSNLRSGLFLGLIDIFAVLLGLPGLIGTIVAGWLNLPSQTPGAWVLLVAIAAWGGARAARSSQYRSGKAVCASGLLSGAAQGLLLALFTWGMSSLINTGADVRKWLAQIYLEALALLTFGLGPIVGACVVLLVTTAASVAGAATAFAFHDYPWRETVTRLGEGVRSTPPVPRATQLVESFRQHRYSRQVSYGIILLVLLMTPFLLNRYWNYIVGTVGIYIILGLGLNIVVGMSGLLNLGYAAFFAIGAYTVAILTAPRSEIMWSFWVALPIGVVLTILTGVLLSIPVLRMRGDYLAIVTLGFGEIIRILARSEALIDLTGGPRGIREVGVPTFFGVAVNPRVYFLYLILLGIALGIVITSRLQNSRLGRALMAMREDEDVAQAVGVYTLRYKVLAFAIGAAFAGLGGVIFASRNKFTGPEDFTLLVSVNVLSLVIIGGMNSIPGVVIGALVLKGLPEMLRELDDYRMLAFGALLVIMMILRPEGLWPSSRTREELRRDEGPDEKAVEQATGV
jgi:branched-chain amino acid transport system permease protein